LMERSEKLFTLDSNGNLVFEPMLQPYQLVNT
jgi:hypothetical protein